MLIQYWYTSIITHRRNVGGLATIGSVSPLPLHIADGQLSRLEGHALQEVEISTGHFSTDWISYLEIIKISIQNYLEEKFQIDFASKDSYKKHTFDYIY